MDDRFDVDRNDLQTMKTLGPRGWPLAQKDLRSRLAKGYLRKLFIDNEVLFIDEVDRQHVDLYFSIAIRLGRLCSIIH